MFCVFEYRLMNGTKVSSLLGLHDRDLRLHVYLTQIDTITIASAVYRGHGLTAVDDL